jgi:HEAT repeat protein
MATAPAKSICYVVLPSDLPSRELLWRQGIAPAFEAPPLAHTFRCVSADDVYHPGAMVEGVRQLLARTSLVIADLTGRDPSVALQVGMAAAMELPVLILLADTASIDDVPFAWQVQPIVQYSPTDPGNADLQRAVLEAVRQTGHPGQPKADFARPLRNLQSDDRFVRRQAEDDLVEIADPAAIRPLCELLSDDSTGVRVSAALVLRRIGGAQVETALVTALTDPRPYVRRMVTWVLRGLRGEQAGEPLMDRLQDGSALVRHAAAWALGELNEQRAGGLLAGLLGDEDPNVRQAAAEALGKLGARSADGPLIAALQDPDGMVRQAAAKALGKLEDEMAVGALIGATRDPGWMVRHAAARALANIGSPAACVALTDLMQDVSEDVRWAAVTGLGAIGGRDAREVLRRAASDPGQTSFIRGLAAAANVGYDDEQDEESSAAAQ